MAHLFAVVILVDVILIYKFLIAVMWNIVLQLYSCLPIILIMSTNIFHSLLIGFGSFYWRTAGLQAVLPSLVPARPKLQLSERREPQVGKCLCEIGYKASSKLVVDGGGSSSLWVVLSLDWRSWVP